MPVDLTKFNAAMSQYLAVNKREIPVILKKVNADIQFIAAQNIPPADKAEIKALEQKSWWFKYIAKLVSKGVKVTRTKKNKATGEKVKVKSTETGRGRSQSSYIRFLKKVSKQIINARARGVGLLRSAFYKAAAAIKGTTPKQGSNLSQSKGYANDVRGEVFKSVGGAVVFSKDADSAYSADIRLNAGLQKALDLKADDMTTYIHRKQQEEAAKLSGKP